MTRIDLDRLPVSLVPQWFSAVGGGWYAHFSLYTYVPQSLDDRRWPIRVHLEEVTPVWLGEQLASLGQNEELAMHSTLTQGRRVMHIPMVDFVVKSTAVGEVARWADQQLKVRLVFFDSGRSLHAYGAGPVSQTHWVRLMGLLLLGNLPDQEPVVDSRWIGHRLLAGYSSLRWSKNTPQYKGWPTRSQSL
jgi:hypothetical protein